MELILSRGHRRRDARDKKTAERSPSNAKITNVEAKGGETKQRRDGCGPYAPPPSTSQLGASPPMDSIAGLAAAPGTATWTKNSADWSSSFMVSCESGVVFETNARVSVKQNVRASNEAGAEQNMREKKGKMSLSLPPSLAAASPSVRVSKHRQMKVVISRDVKHLIMPEGPVIPDASDEAAPNEGRRDVGPRAKSRDG